MGRQKNKEDREAKTIYYIVKHTVMEYSLMKMELLGNEVVSDTPVHKDIPAIVYGKLFQKVKQQAVE